MGKTASTSQQQPQQTPGLTVALDTPSAHVLARQASIIQDLEFVMDCCKRLLTELAKPEADRDGIVPLALWSSALLAYGRCFGPGGLLLEDVQNVPLQGAVINFHHWVIAERDTLTNPPADPLAAAKIGAALTAPGSKERQVEGIAVFSTSRVLIDVTGVRQLGGLASELAKQTAGKARKQQDTVLSEAKQLDLAALYESPPLLA